MALEENGMQGSAFGSGLPTDYVERIRGKGGMEVGEEGDYIPIATLSPPE